MVSFLDLDDDGLRRVILESMLQSQEFTVVSLHEEVKKEIDVSQKAVASMTGYISSRLGILHVNRKSYRAPRTYMLRDEYADIAREVLASL